MKKKSKWYVAVHNWLRYNYGSADHCENPECYYPRLSSADKSKTVMYDEPTGFEWANISGDYRRDRDDYMQLCVLCHRKHDNGQKRVNLNTDNKESPWQRMF